MFFMPLPTVLSFETLDQAHYIATGEHLPHREGSAAPLPLEHYIKETQKRQERSRLWELLDEFMGNELTGLKPGVVNGLDFCKAMRYRDEIHLFNTSDKLVIILTPDGIILEDTHEVSSEPFILQSPWLEDTEHPCFQLSEEKLLEEHAAAKEEVVHAHEHLTAVQTALRVKHIGRT